MAKNMLHPFPDDFEDLERCLKRRFSGRTVQFVRRYNVTPPGTIGRVTQIKTREFRMPEVIVQWEFGGKLMQRTVQGNEAEDCLKVIG